MKASLKFREETRKPLFKAKIPLNIIGFPFQSTLAAGDSPELCLCLRTSFQTGPSFRTAYHPNDPSNLFSFIVKTGVGHFGSPVDSPFTFSAEFNFPGGNSISKNPMFFLHFKPQFGDFSLKKSHNSEIKVFSDEHKNGNGAVFADGEDDVEFIERPFNSDVNGCKMTVSPLRCSVKEAVSGVELGAKTVLPIINGAVLKLRWGMNLLEGFENVFANPKARMWPRGIPQLRLNKIGIEHVARDDRRKEEVVGSQQEDKGAEVVAEVCLGLKRQLEMVRVDNALLGKALEDMRVEFGKVIVKGRRDMKLGDGKENDFGIEDMKKP